MKLACDNPQVQAPLQQEFSFDAAVTGLAFLAEGTLATGLGDGSVRLIAPRDTASPRTVRPHREGAAVLAMVTDIDGAAVVTGGDDGKRWRPGEPRDSKLVFIGRNLNPAELRAGFAACLAA